MSSFTGISITRDTKAKLDRIAEHDRRSLSQSVDVLADEYIERHGIDLNPAGAADNHAGAAPTGTG